MQIVEVPISRIAELAEISIAFEAHTTLEISPSPEGKSEFLLREKPLPVPFAKDYDALPGNLPADWARQFDTRNWGLLFASEQGVNIGGALIAHHTPGVDMLDGRTDLAVLWDIRVAREFRGRGIGTALFKTALDWAKKRGCRELKVETQNNNSAAVRFYLKQGCELRHAVADAYPELPGEQKLLFYRSLV